MVVTLKDIAQKAGVSVTTVSRILNGRDSGVPIRDETRLKVISLAHEMGYKPNIMARALRGSRSSLIGVLAQNITSLFHSQILRGLNDAAVKRAYRVFLGHVQQKIDIAIDYGSMLEQSHADGILIIGELEGDEDALNVLLSQHHYVVGVSDRIGPRGFPGVYADSVTGTNLMMEHLWNLGHRNIICVTDPKIQDGVLRAEMYRRFLIERNARDYVRVVQTARSFQASRDTGLGLFAEFRGKQWPTAIFATTDVIAIGLLQAAFQAQVRAPEDISIAGYDDLDIAAYTIPPLTTVRQSGFEMGQVAANLLLDMIEQENSSGVEDVVLSPTLVTRQSTSAPAAGAR
jgi:DNA-binding LacI/PurR family transcriptional regulator